MALPTPPSGKQSKVTSSIPADCSVDVTSRLQGWVDGVPDNSSLIFPAKACYRIDGTLKLENRHRLLLQGNGTTLMAVTTGTRTRSNLAILGGADITVTGLVVRGANPHAGARKEAYVPALEAQHGYQVSGASRVLLDSVQAFDVYGDFVYVGPDNADNHPSENVTVERSTFERSGRQGITVTGGVNVVVADSTFGDAARSLIDLEANGRLTAIRHVLFLRNTTGPARNFWLANKGEDADIGDLRFIGNRMTGGTGGLVFVYGTGQSVRGPYLFEDNQLIANDDVHDEGSKGAFFFTHAEDITIRGNSVRFARGMPAIELRAAHHVTVAGNHFTGQGALVLATEGSSDYHVS